MVTKKRGLGKNLNALLFDTLGEENFKLSTSDSLDNSSFDSETLNLNTQELSFAQLQPGKYQPRREISPTELESLADSIRAQGIIQPIVVRALNEKGKDGLSQFEIIAGERRWRAAQLVGLEKVPVVIRDVSDQAAMCMALIENIQRENLNPIEEAFAFERLAKEFSLTHIQISEIVGKSRAAITNSLRLLTLNEEIKKFLEQRLLDVGHAKVLLTLREAQQLQIAKIVVEKGLSVRETECLVAEAQKPKGEKIARSSKHLDPDIVRLQNALSDKLGAPTRLVHSQQGKGKIVIHYNSLDELDGVLAHLDPSLV